MGTIKLIIGLALLSSMVVLFVFGCDWLDSNYSRKPKTIVAPVIIGMIWLFSSFFAVLITQIDFWVVEDQYDQSCEKATQTLVENGWKAGDAQKVLADVCENAETGAHW